MFNLRKRSIYSRHKVLFIWAGIVVEIVLLAALAVLAIVVFGSIYFRVVEHPKFCGSLCHNMKPSYESYKNSTHNGVHCAECHSREGFADGFLKDTIYAAGKEVFVYLEGEDFYDMDEVHPKVYDEGCLRPECHKVDTLIEKKNLFMEDNIFTHNNHLSAASIEAHTGGPTAAETSGSSLELNCTSCHSQSKDKHMAVDKRICFLCHFDSEADEAAMQNCTSCHAIPAPDHDEYMADEEIESCNDCHGMEAGEITVSLEKCTECHKTEMKQVDAGEAHKQHVGKQEARCMECHEPIEHE